MKERTKLIWIILIFLAIYYIPWNHAVIRQSGLEAFMMLQEYAREHVLTCLIPAFFIAGALMYFATLTEVPILQGLLGAGMGKGPALALLLAGPALSLPNMLVIGSVMGVKKTAVFCSIIIILSTIAGMLFGAFALGLAYGVLSGSCTFGFIAPILAIITVQQKIATGILFILLFAVGHCLPIMVAGSSMAAVRKLIENSAWQGESSGNLSHCVYPQTSIFIY